MTDEDNVPKCKGCQENIDTESESECVILQVVNAEWHSTCFRCSQCQIQLSSWYILRGGKLLCRKDYWAKFRHLCNGCSLRISGPVMVAGEHRYHPECFQCCLCSVYIGQDEPYVLVERTALYCGHCYDSHVTAEFQEVSNETTTSLPLPPPPQSSSSSSSTSSYTSAKETPSKPMTNTAPRSKPRRIPHTIHMVKLPPSQHHQHPKELQNQQGQVKNSIDLNGDKDYSDQKGNNKEQKDDDQSYDLKREQKKINQNVDDNKDLEADTNKDSDRDVDALEQKQQKDQSGLRLSFLHPRGNNDSGGNYVDGNHYHSFGGRMGPATKIAQLDKNDSDFKDLEVGDCILEINGSSMRDKSLEEIYDAICNRSTSMNIVVERDPNPLPVPKREPEPVTSVASPTSGESTIMVGNTPVRLRNKATLRARGYSPNKRRSKSPSPCPSGRQRMIDLSRSRSFTSQNLDHRVFRPVDIVIGEILGQGFFGKAMKASHKVTGEFMVLKELHNFDEDAQKGFLTEVSMLRNLSHPCVLKFLGVLYRDKKLTLVTEFIDGGTLSSLLINKNEELSWIERLKLAKDIANGMSYLHSMDVIHRDLNSGNCFVRKDRSVVVGDFGLAKIFPSHSYSQMFPSVESKKGDSNSGKASRRKPTSRKKRQTVVGNPYSMAPEMLKSEGVYDEKVDIFAYGIIVFETVARVTTDPDYFPRSLDLGVNVEAFHRRYCQNTPEPYTMLAALSSHIEPDKRPSFDKIVVLCESLHLHLEHGGSVPVELKGSCVQFYRATKERLYGINYKDTDSVEEAEMCERKRKEQSRQSALSNEKACNKDSSTSHGEIGFTSSVVSDNESMDDTVPENVLNSPLQTSNNSPTSSLTSSRVSHSDSSSVMSSKVDHIVDPESSKLNKSFPADANLRSSSSHDDDHHHQHKLVSSTGEDSTYFSCSSLSSLSPFTSSSSVTAHNEASASCKPVPDNPKSCLDETCLDSNNSNNNNQRKPYSSNSIQTSREQQQQQEDKQGQDEKQKHKQQQQNALQYHQQSSKRDTSSWSQSSLSHNPAETDTDTSFKNPDQHSSPQSSQSYFLHLDHCIHSNDDGTEMSYYRQYKSKSIDDNNGGVNDPQNQSQNSSVEREFSLLLSDFDDNETKDIQNQPSLPSSESSNDRTRLSIDDDEKRCLSLSLDRCHSPILDSYMCSSRRRQKKARNSMNLDQSSPTTLSPQPKSELDWENVSARNDDNNNNSNA